MRCGASPSSYHSKFQPLAKLVHFTFASVRILSPKIDPMIMAIRVSLSPGLCLVMQVMQVTCVISGIELTVGLLEPTPLRLNLEEMRSDRLRSLFAVSGPASCEVPQSRNKSLDPHVVCSGSCRKREMTSIVRISVSILADRRRHKH